MTHMYDITGTGRARPWTYHSCTVVGIARDLPCEDGDNRRSRARRKRSAAGEGVCLLVLLVVRTNQPRCVSFSDGCRGHDRNRPLLKCEHTFDASDVNR